MPYSEQFLIEAFKSAREELMMRISHRDKILKQAIIVFGLIFIVLFNIPKKYEVSSEIVTFLLIFIHFISLFFYSLYQKEDYLIGRLSDYINNEINGRLGYKEILLWDSSGYFKGDEDKSMEYRYITTIFVFILTPIIIHSLYLLLVFLNISILLELVNKKVVLNLITNALYSNFFIFTIFIYPMIINIYIYLLLDMKYRFNERKNTNSNSAVKCEKCSKIISRIRCTICNCP